jgi:hypothetical protein
MDEVRPPFRAASTRIMTSASPSPFEIVPWPRSSRPHGIPVDVRAGVVLRALDAVPVYSGLSKKAFKPYLFDPITDGIRMRP